MPVAANLTHFAVNADDIESARRFYESVLGWRFHAWGPPGFFQIETGDETAEGVLGALQQRRELVPGARTIGFECTFGVDDVDRVAAAVVANGGRLLMEKTTITGVGDLIWFEDPAGNVAGAMRYEHTAEQPPPE
jgi:predicted enzyme related to lactoylglutathione lyase